MAEDQKKPRSRSRPAGSAKNLSTAWNNVTAEDIEVGCTLYGLYRQRIAQLADEWQFPLAAACGAFAALSPQSPITSNFRSLAACMRSVRGSYPAEVTTVSTFNRGKEAAFLILKGDVDFSDVCKGPKITAFRHNLLFPHTSDRVTIDGHMIGIMAGKPDLGMREALFHERGDKGGNDLTRYAAAERAFLWWWCRSRDAKALPPCSVQAILWHAKRRNAGGGADAGHGLPDKIEPYPLKE
jgi:hypothetical protein